MLFYRGIPALLRGGDAPFLFVAGKEGIMPDNLLDELARWIDTAVIAEAILQELENQNMEQTFANGQRIWLDFLGSELSEGLRSSIKAR